MAASSSPSASITTVTAWTRPSWGMRRRRHRHAPGADDRGVEIDGTIADDINRSVIQEQVEMGVAVRMAAMDLLAWRRRQMAA